MGDFRLATPYSPTGDQPQAIEALCQGFADGLSAQTLLGVTGSGKTYTMASVIAALNRPTLVLAHNKTLAGQLHAEFSSFFPDNAVEYFVSYYDYYQPEAYIPSSDVFIEKDCDINDEIDRLRHSATSSLLERRDVIVVASVSCIYGLGSPSDYKTLMVSLRPGQTKSRDEVIESLVAIQFSRNDLAPKRGTFRVRGDVIDIHAASSDRLLIRVSFFGDEIERISEYDAVTGKLLAHRSYVSIFPASHYATDQETIKRAVLSIQKELDARLKVLTDAGKLLEAYRLEQRTRYDIDMLLETGFTKGIENYSRHLTGRAPGEPPYTLLDFFPDDYLLFIDESHVTIPQIGAMYEGDRSRKVALVDYGFRLPSAFDNRPLRFAEFERKMGQTLFVSATPSRYEASHAKQVVEQVIRPTGLLDPIVEVHPVEGQIDDVTSRLKDVIARGERALILTLTKRMAEDLTDFLQKDGFKVAYLHSDIATVERLCLLRDLRKGRYDVLVGINLLREGLDLPEVSLIAILDADKEGFLRSATSLVQIIGRAARNVNGTVVLYADRVTPAMETAVAETNRRRALQQAYNEAHGVVPRSIEKAVHEVVDTQTRGDEEDADQLPLKDEDDILKEPLTALSPDDLRRLVKRLTREMNDAARALAFEEAAELRDCLIAAQGVLSGKRDQGGSP